MDKQGEGWWIADVERDAYGNRLVVWTNARSRAEYEREVQLREARAAIDQVRQVVAGLPFKGPEQRTALMNTFRKLDNGIARAFR